MNGPISLPLQQHQNFGAALTLLGRTVSHVPINGAAPVQTIKRYGLCFASRGPIWQSGSTDGRAQDLRRSGLHLINSDGQDSDSLARAGFRQIKTPSYVAEVSLAGKFDDRLGRMAPKWRNIFRRTETANISITDDPFCTTHHAWLLDEDTKQQKAKRFRSLPHVFLHAYAISNPDCVRVFTAFKGRDPIAAMVFLLRGCVATYHLGWSNHQGRKCAAHHAIMVNAWGYLADRSITRLDLGAVDTVNAPGLARFKIGTGAHIRPLGGTWLRMPWC